MARILVVDDEEGLREFLAEALLTAGHSVTSAADGQEAADRLDKSAYDLLITDLRMPRMDGMELLRKARDEAPEMEVVLLTAHGSVETAVEAVKLGAFDYLQKPIHSPDELRLCAARALERRTLLDLKESTSRDAEEAPQLGYGDPAMDPVVHALGKVAPTEATVLLLGESGTGKELAARWIHSDSQRAAGPFMAINCAAISETLIESELFGHEKGSFTGATGTRRGRLELAAGGTFFLDEIGEMSAPMQAKLLRVIQENTFERVGGSRSYEADVRWIAATHRDLEEMIGQGSFREDLYHRLAVFPVELPPLRERRADIIPLAAYLLRQIGPGVGKRDLDLSDDAKALLTRAEWSGNVRELSNALERAAILADGDRLEPKHFLLSGSKGREAGKASTLEEMERELITATLADVGGNRRRAAERLGIGERTLYDKLKRYDLG